MTGYADADHYAALYGSVPRKYAFKAGDRGGAETWRESFRAELRGALGVANMERDLAGYAPRAEVVERDEMPGGIIREKMLFWTEPDVPLPVWVLRRKDLGGRLPVVLTPHGHNHPEIYAGITANEEEKKSMTEGERDIAVQAAREGYLAILPTARGFGGTRTAADREAGKLHSCRTELLHGLLVGRTAIGERVWDVSRLIDWAQARPDADGTRIAITGNSGGGTTSLFSGACETRITVTVPSCYFCTFAGSIGSINHCDCNYVPGVMRLGEMYDVAGLTAPRPFCAIAGEHDDIFPIAHAREAHAKLAGIYSVFGVPDRCEMFVGSGGHRYYQDGSWPFIRKWFGKV